MFALALALAQCLPADPIDDLVRAEMERSKTPGIALAVLKDGKPIKMQGYGYANLEHKVPVKPETIFQTGSVGKQFAAMLAMIYVKEGKLSLDDDIGKFFPEAKGAWDGIQVRHLLSHTSGLPDLPYWEMDLRKDHTEDDLIKYMVAQKDPIKYEPGIEWRYNNGGYVRLGILLRRVGGKFYGDLMQEKIFGPIGMKTARVISEADIVMDRAAGYQMSEQGIKNQAWVAPMTNTTADGALYVSLHDMAAWDAALYTEQLLPKSLMEQMYAQVNRFPRREGETETTKRGYGFGWFITTDGDTRLVEHSGGWQGFAAYIGRRTDKGTTVVLLSNLDTTKVESLGRAILKHLDEE